MGGLRLALSLFTVAPVRADRVDRATARGAMVLAPLAGALLGLVLALLAGGLVRLGASALLGGAVLVALGLLFTRGLHVDGLADTADGLGSYAGPDKALEIMKKSDIGPFGVAAIAAVLLVDAAAVTSLLSGPLLGGSLLGGPLLGGPKLGGPKLDWSLPDGSLPDGSLLGGSLLDGPLLGGSLPAVVLAFAAGRLGATVACRRGLAAARPEGLGALVAETVPVWLLGLVTIVTAALGVLVDPVHGPLAVLAAVAVAWLLTAHARRRLGGVTGDVIGAAIELSTAAALIVLAT